MANEQNWVERRANRESALDVRGPELWNEIRGAIQDACDSFKERYQPTAGQQVICRLENGKRILITTQQPRDNGTRSVLTTVSFDPQQLTVTAVSGDDSGPLVFHIKADDSDVSIVVEDKPLTPDEVSERILGNLLFPSTAHTRPARPPNRPSSTWS